MGYGWPDLGDPVLSDCDVDALAFVFAWALEGRLLRRPARARTTARRASLANKAFPGRSPCAAGVRRLPRVSHLQSPA